VQDGPSTFCITCHKKYSQYRRSQSEFKPGTARIRSRSTNHSPTTLRKHYITCADDKSSLNKRDNRQEEGKIGIETRLYRWHERSYYYYSFVDFVWWRWFSAGYVCGNTYSAAQCHNMMCPYLFVNKSLPPPPPAPCPKVKEWIDWDRVQDSQCSARYCDVWRSCTVRGCGWKATSTCAMRSWRVSCRRSK
jgi:hypothetical protein